MSSEHSCNHMCCVLRGQRHKGGNATRGNEREFSVHPGRILGDHWVDTCRKTDIPRSARARRGGTAVQVRRGREDLLVRLRLSIFCGLVLLGGEGDPGAPSRHRPPGSAPSSPSPPVLTSPLPLPSLPKPIPRDLFRRSDARNRTRPAIPRACCPKERTPRVPPPAPRPRRCQTDRLSPLFSRPKLPRASGAGLRAGLLLRVSGSGSNPTSFLLCTHFETHLYTENNDFTLVVEIIISSCDWFCRSPHIEKGADRGGGRGPD